MGLLLLFKVYYFREHQASHSARKCLRSQSVLQTFTSSLSLATAKSPRWHWDRSCCSLARAQRLGLTQQQLHTHTLHPAHTVPATAPLWHRAVKPIHTASLTAENTSTANQEHLQEHCSFPLHLQFPPEVNRWHGADQ